MLCRHWLLAHCPAQQLARSSRNHLFDRDLVRSDLHLVWLHQLVGTLVRRSVSVSVLAPRIMSRALTRVWSSVSFSDSVSDLNRRLFPFTVPKPLPL